MALNLRKSQILPHAELHRSEKSAKKPNHITYASVKAIFFQWSLEWFSLTGCLSPSEKFKAEWQPKPWAPELEMLLECRCVWLSKTREIASEVGERVCLFFKDCFNEIKKKKLFFIWCIFSSVNVSVFLPPWVRFLFLFTDVFINFLTSVPVWLKHIFQRDILFKLLVWCFHAL